MWDYVFVFTCASGVASSGALIHVLNECRRSSTKAGGEGYVAYSGSSVNLFKMI